MLILLYKLQVSLRIDMNTSFQTPLFISLFISLFYLLFSLLLSGCGGGGGSSDIASQDPVKVLIPPNYSIQVFERSVDTKHMCNAPNAPAELENNFVEIAEQVGLDFSHQMANGDNLFGQSGGVGAGDYNNDGWVDLYAIGGDDRPSLLLTNLGDGTFVDVASQVGLDLFGKSSGPSFADIDGDGLLDLFVGNVDDGEPKLFLNTGEDGFLDITLESGLELPGNNISAAWGDFDQDNDMDLLLAHWSLEVSESNRYLWRNNGDLTFTNVSDETNLYWDSERDLSFAPGFADINNDGLQDILFVADGGTSKVFLNQANGKFADITTEQISDKSGMGSAIGDYDNDGDLDWFVSSISRGSQDTQRIFGNRLYQNQGNGEFIDVTNAAGVREGHWGWGSCFDDFNNDGNLDIFHVNGFYGQSNFLLVDPSRLFMSNGNGSFTERSVELGIDDTGMGRGIVCFDYDRDGDQDIFVANHDQPARLYCNYGNQNTFVNIRLEGQSPNVQALGARIYVTTGEVEQMRELNANSNYVSQNPVEAHFGLGAASNIDKIRVVWPGGVESIIENVAVDQFLIIKKL
jgi:hypothetical protein